MADIKIVVDNKKATPRFDLEKVPDEILLKYARIEIGQLKSYIAELEDELENIKKSKYAGAVNARLNEEVNQLRKENKTLRKRKGDSAVNVSLKLSWEEKQRLSEIAYRNNMVQILKTEHDAYKVKCQKLQLENEKIRDRYTKLMIQYVALTRSE